MVEVDDLDQLAARLHGRRSRMAEGGRLASLCALGSVSDLAGALFPGAGLASSAGLQARLAAEAALELDGLAGGLDFARANYLRWLAARFQAENLKTAVRAVLAGAAAGAAGLFIELQDGGYGPALLSAKDLRELSGLAPSGPLRGGLVRALSIYGLRDTALFYEAEIDRAYFRELLARAAALPWPDRGAARNLAGAELEIFLLALAARAKPYYGLEKKELAGLYLEGSGLSRRKFLRLCETAGEPGGPDPAGLEASAWTVYARLANRAFRRSNIDFGVVAGYAALRRVEAANLVTVAEGLRLGLTPAGLLRRLLNAGEREAVNV